AADGGLAPPAGSTRSPARAGQRRLASLPGFAIEGYVIVSVVLFALGIAGVLVRRSPLVMLMAIELLWGAAALLFLAFARQFALMDGHVFSFLILVVGSAEAAIGLGLIVLLFRAREAVDVGEVRELRG